MPFFQRSTLALMALVALVVFCFSVSAIQADVEAPVEISAGVDRTQGYVGDRFTLTIVISYDAALQVIPPAGGKKLGDLEVQSFHWGESEEISERRRRIKGEFQLWALNVGPTEIPPLTVLYQDSLGNGGEVVTSAITVEVLSHFDPALDSLAPDPMREPIDNPLQISGLYQSRDWMWYAGGAALISALALGWYFLRRREKEAQEALDTRPPWEKAFERLAALRNTSLIAEERYKEYYSELTESLREFLGRICQIPALDMTTNELLSSLGDNTLVMGHQEKLADVLTRADIVKFARATPSPEQPSQDFDSSYEMISALSEVYRERQRQEEERLRLLEKEKRDSASPKSESNVAENATDSITSVTDEDKHA